MSGKGPVLVLNNGVEMPAFGFGVFQSAPEDAVKAVKSAIANGYRLIDTAAAYLNEVEVGEAIRESGVDRSEVFLTTKLWLSDYGYDKTLHAFDRSMRKLRIDYLDLYLLHWPFPAEFENTIASYRAAEKLLTDGRVRAIGVSNFNPGHLELLLARSAVVPAVNQIELHPFFSQKELRAADSKLGIVTQAWSPIGGINRYWAPNPEKPNDPLVHPTIVELATKYAKTAAQIVLRWQIDIGTSPIPKSVRPERIAENIDIFDFVLSQAEIAAIDALDTGKRGGPDPELVSSQMFDNKIED